MEVFYWLFVSYLLLPNRVHSIALVGMQRHQIACGTAQIKRRVPSIWTISKYIFALVSELTNQEYRNCLPAG
jgi:hypothetical protein